jgi:selenocysteine lyase/cysteine desulfurase
VDGVALAPHRQVDVKALDVDFYVSLSCSPHLGNIVVLAVLSYHRPYNLLLLA